MLKLDALFNLLGVLITFIVVLLAQINPPTSPTVDPPGNMAALISWPPGNQDVDLWVQYADEPGVGYSNKSGRVWSLLRDDIGAVNDITDANYENAFTRGLPNGEYAINVRCYSCSAPVRVGVEVRTADGALIWRGVVDLASKQERTAIRFRMRDGAVVAGSESFVFKNVRGV